MALRHRFDLDMGPFGKQPCEVLEVVTQKLLKYKFASGTLDFPMGRHAFDGMKNGWPKVLDRMRETLNAGKRDNDA